MRNGEPGDLAEVGKARRLIHIEWRVDPDAILESARRPAPDRAGAAGRHHLPGAAAAPRPVVDERRGRAQASCPSFRTWGGSCLAPSAVAGLGMYGRRAEPGEVPIAGLLPQGTRRPGPRAAESRQAPAWA
ncbi:hypothetical protein [Streptomyces sp. RB17]|uniref:hypothetical protein n=1 Tax=Streptomyces sp. RB17 TaxID=2585197 RepID=UPI001294C84B|nr:hypothetical protein [Streptomyces sp. RB17]